MNNVIDFEVTAEQAARKAFLNGYYNGCDFPVEYSSLYLEDGTHVPNKKASVNDITGQILGIHSNSYRPLTHKEMVDTQRGIIDRSGMADSSVQETISLNPTGKKCFVKHTLPNHSLTTPDGDTAALTFLAINSFCGTWAFQTSVGANQDACQNNQVFTSGAASIYKSRHYRHLNVEHAADVITKAIPIFMGQVDLWHDWHGTNVNDFKALLIFAETLGNSTIKNIIHQHMAHSESGGDKGIYLTVNGEYLFSRDEIRRSRNFMYMWDKWNTHYRNTLGANLWAVYNTLTDWATHVQGRTNNVANIQHTRGLRIQKVLNKDTLGFRMAA